MHLTSLPYARRVGAPGVRRHSAQSLINGVSTFDGLAQSRFVARVADDELSPAELVRFVGRAHERRDVVASRQRLVDDQPPGAASRAEHQNVRFVR